MGGQQDATVARKSHPIARAWHSLSIAGQVAERQQKFASVDTIVLLMASRISNAKGSSHEGHKTMYFIAVAEDGIERFARPRTQARARTLPRRHFIVHGVIGLIPVFAMIAGNTGMKTKRVCVIGSI